MMARHRRPQPPEDPFAGLREQLRTEAERHQPDRDRIWARVEAGLAGGLAESPALDDPVPLGPRSRRRGLRVAAAALGTAAVVIIAPVMVLQSTGDDNEPAPPPIGQQPLDSPRPSARSTGPGNTPAGTGKSPLTTPEQTPQVPSSGPPTATVVPPGTNPARPTGLVDAVGSVDPTSNAYWGQNNLKLDVRRQLTKLTVVIRIQRTDRVDYHGAYTSLPNADFRVDHDVTDETVTYRFTLIEGRKVAQGRWLFAAQYKRGRNHDPSKDTFTVTAAETGKAGTAKGTF